MLCSFSLGSVIWPLLWWSLDDTMLLRWYYDVSFDVVSTCMIFQSPSAVITTFTVGLCVIIQWWIFVWVSVISLAVGRDRAIHYNFVMCGVEIFGQNFHSSHTHFGGAPPCTLTTSLSLATRRACSPPLLLTRVHTHRRTSSMVSVLPCAVLPATPTQWCACSLSPSLPCPRC